MTWASMTWTQRFNAVAQVYGSTNSDCGGDELLHLWDEIQLRGLQLAYIDALAALLTMDTVVHGYTPEQIMQMMTASDESAHWIAALRAAGQEVVA